MVPPEIERDEGQRQHDKPGQEQRDVGHIAQRFEARRGAQAGIEQAEGVDPAIGENAIGQHYRAAKPQQQAGSEIEIAPRRARKIGERAPQVV